MAKLILRGEQGDREIPLQKNQSVTIGRTPDCDLPIDDTQASRRHCTVQWGDGGWEVSDLGSTNGTLVNSTLIKTEKLYDGDAIRIGACEIVLADPDAVRPTGGGGACCSLVYAKGPRKGQRVELREQRTTLGRKGTNTIVLEDTVASSYHCEVVRDLNGYTLRDLGSTNGTLLNNEMVTEAALTHGARVRIGNTRLVFQDPAMAEIDLELAGADEDEAEWGMMRELDLAAVRKRNPATTVYALLFVGILGAGAWFLTQEPKKKDVGPPPPAGNLHAAWSFEDGGASFTWESEPPDTMRVDRSTSVKAQGKASLELRSSAPESTAFYSSVIPAVSGRRYKLSGKLAARSGAKASLGVQWRGSGLVAWSASPMIDSGGLTAVAVTASAPPWARSARIGVRVAGEGKVYLDDVALVPAGSSGSKRETSGNFEAEVTDERILTILNSVPILFDGRAVAEGADGTSLDASQMRFVTKKVDDKHLLVMISGAPEGTVRAGVRLIETGSYLSRGGFRAFGDAADGSTYFVSAFPDEGSTRLQRVRKLLVGPPGRACAFVASADDRRLGSVATVEGRRRFWTILGGVEGGAVSFRIKTDLTGDFQDASKGIGNSIRLHEDLRWGDFLKTSDRVLAEFPFADKTMRRRLADLGRQVRKDRESLGSRIDALMKDYDEFKDLKSLDDIEMHLKTLRTDFQIESGKGPWGEKTAAWSAEAGKKRTAALSERQKTRAEARMALAKYIFEGRKPPAIHSAAVVYAYIGRYLGASPSAIEAAAALAGIKKGNARIDKVLGDLGLGEGN